MCLLSFAKIQNSYVFTSNRDIDRERPSADRISRHIINDKVVFFPQDYKGGSWAVHDESTVMILLNGGVTKHKSKEKYRLSRGKILIDLFTQDDVLTYWNEFDLHDIEPFTVVYFSKDNILTEFIWDDRDKHTTILDSQINHIWLSSTLYSNQEKGTIKDIYNTTSFLTAKDLMDFNSKYVYKYIKADSKSRIACIETTCHYQFTSSKSLISTTEVIL